MTFRHPLTLANSNFGAAMGREREIQIISAQQVARGVNVSCLFQDGNRVIKKAFLQVTDVSGTPCGGTCYANTLAEFSIVRQLIFYTRERWENLKKTVQRLFHDCKIFTENIFIHNDFSSERQQQQNAAENLQKRLIFDDFLTWLHWVHCCRERSERSVECIFILKARFI